MSVPLDPLDRRILNILQQRADIASQELAELANSSPSSCWRRVKSLEETGVLGPSVRLVDPEMVGQGLNVFCQIRMKSQDQSGRAAFEAFVEAQEAVIECYSVSGDWDYLLHIVTRDVADYERVLMHGILNHTSIAGSSSIFALRRVKHTTALPV